MHFIDENACNPEWLQLLPENGEPTASGEYGTVAGDNGIGQSDVIVLCARHTNAEGAKRSH